MQVNADPNLENDIALNNLPTAVQTQFGLLGGELLAAALSFAKGSASLVSLNGGNFGEPS